MSVLAAFVVPHPPLIIPAVGRGREAGIQATIDAYRRVAAEIAELAPHTIVISSPHATLYRDYFHVSPGAGARGDFSRFGAPQASYRASYDTQLVAAFERLCQEQGIAAGTLAEREPALDHGTMIPLHFVNQRIQDFDVVRIGLSGFSPAEHYRVGRAMAQAARELDRRVVWIASGDLSHKLTPDGPYGYAPEGPRFDAWACDALARADLVELLACDPSLAERAAECGLRSFQMMAGAFDRTPLRAELLSHEGPFGVGYGVACLYPTGAEAADPSCDWLAAYEQRRAHDLARRKAAEDAHVRLARAALEAYVRDRTRIAVPAGLPAELAATRAGCFVSLKVDGALRGCIGTIAPTQPSLAEEIVANAISAGTRDPRFAPVDARELPDLVYDVDVLGAPEPVAGPHELDPRRYGVIVSCADGRRGLLLPDLDGVDTVEEQLDIAARKGGIDLVGDAYRLERFEVVRHL